MKKIVCLIFIVGALVVNIWGLEERGKAVIYTTKSQVISADEILANFGKKWNVSLIFDGERVKSNLDINNIKRLEIYKWDNEDEWWIEGKVVLKNKNTELIDDELIESIEEPEEGSVVEEPEEGSVVEEPEEGSVVEETEVGNEFVEYMILANPDSLFKRDQDYIIYRKYDPINNELVSNRIWSKSILTVEFGSDVGIYKVDVAGNKFNADYIYSPYTGEKMEFGN